MNNTKYQLTLTDNYNYIMREGTAAIEFCNNALNYTG